MFDRIEHPIWGPRAAFPQVERPTWGAATRFHWVERASAATEAPQGGPSRPRRCRNARPRTTPTGATKSPDLRSTGSKFQSEAPKPCSTGSNTRFGGPGRRSPKLNAPCGAPQLRSTGSSKLLRPRRPPRAAPDGLEGAARRAPRRPPGPPIYVRPVEIVFSKLLQGVGVLAEFIGGSGGTRDRLGAILGQRGGLSETISSRLEVRAEMRGAAPAPRGRARSKARARGG